MPAREGMGFLLLMYFVVPALGSVSPGTHLAGRFGPSLGADVPFSALLAVTDAR